MRVLNIRPAANGVLPTAVFACGCEAAIETMVPLAIGGVVLCKGDERGTHAQVVADMISGVLKFTGADGQPPSGKPGWGGSPLEPGDLRFETFVRVVGSARRIATVHGEKAERQANAKLFAAAPEMRDALLGLVEDYQHLCDEEDPESEGGKLLRAARAALEKAGVR